MANAIPTGWRSKVEAALAEIEAAVGKRFGGEADPLLVSVRSGARVSMPGMMDTVLNLGLNDRTVEALAASSGDRRFAFDSYRRFVQMFADVALGVDRGLFEEEIEILKDEKGVDADADLDAGDWSGLRRPLQGDRAGGDRRGVSAGAARPALGGHRRGDAELADAARANLSPACTAFPRSGGTASMCRPWCSAIWARTAPRASPSRATPPPARMRFTANIWSTPRAKTWWPASATPQSLTVADAEARGSTLPAMERAMPEAFARLMEMRDRLERHFRDMQDIEFTVETGRLWMLQTRSGKRTAQAALQIAVDLVDEGAIGPEEAVMRIEPEALEQLLHPTLDPDAERDVIARGLPASPGAASGRIVFTADAAESRRPRMARRSSWCAARPAPRISTACTPRAAS